MSACDYMLIEYVHTATGMCLVWGGGGGGGGGAGYTTHTVRVSNGVKQGGVLSPVHFTVCMDELLVRLVKSRCGCYIVIHLFIIY